MTLTRAAIISLTAALCAGTPAYGQDAIYQPSNNVQSMQVLSAADADRYREIFADERAGRFDKASALMAQVSDTSLKGYVQAEHFLSPHSKRTAVSELVDWLKEYRDLPVADRIYRLAVNRSTKKVRRHHHTILVAVVTNIPAPAAMPHQRGGGYEYVNIPDPPLTTDAARSASAQINEAIKADQPDQAMAVLQPLIDSGNIPPYDIARLSQRIAASYFTEGMDQKAFDLASREAAVSERSVPMLDWNAGLAAFRLGMFHESAQYFEVLAQVGRHDARHEKSDETRRLHHEEESSSAGSSRQSRMAAVRSRRSRPRPIVVNRYSRFARPPRSGTGSESDTRIRPWRFSRSSAAYTAATETSVPDEVRISSRMATP